MYCLEKLIMEITIKLVATFIVISLISACGNNKSSVKETNTSDTIVFENDEMAVVSEAGGGTAKVNLPNDFEEGTIMLSLENYFTQDEVNRYNSLEFYGLFYDSVAAIYNLRKTPVSFIETGIHYDDGRTSFECGVVIKDRESCLFLLHNKYLTQPVAKIKNVLTEPRFFQAGESMKFSIGDNEFGLSASDYVVEPNGSQTHMDYKLMLNGKFKDGTSSETLLSFIPWFDDGSVNVLFIGDLDGDTYPDFIIDNSSKYTGVTKSGVFYSTKASTIKGMPKPISVQEEGSIGKQEYYGELGC
jgi:hypothetical protein